jgi:hypothetical protein
MMAASRRYFPFVQFEFAHSLGLAAGRYVMQPVLTAADAPRPTAVRVGAGPPDGAAIAPPVDQGMPIPRGEGDERLLASADVLVIRVRGAQAASGGFLRRGRREDHADADPAVVPVTIATLVRGTRMLADEVAADQLVRSMDPDEQEAWVRGGVADLNRAVAAYRVCAADPYVFDISRADPRAVRIGHGFAEEVFAGRWTRSVRVAPPPAPRLARHLRLAPSQGTAAVLAGQGAVMESEELVLRVLLDLDQGRIRAAAVGLKGARDLLLGELAGQVLSGRVRVLVDAVDELGESLATLAQRACRTELGADDARELAAYAEQVGAAIDRWRYEPLGY